MGVNTKLACSSHLAWGLQHLAATGVQLVEAPASTARSQSNVVQLVGSGTAFPFSSGTNAFANQVLRWNSRGEARLDPATLSRVIEIGLQPSANGVIRNASNYSAIQINALSGAVSVFRP